METVVSQHVRHLGRHLGFFKKIILRKTAARFTGISRKHVFAASNRNIIKNSLSKSYSFLIETLISIINYA